MQFELAKKKRGDKETFYTIDAPCYCKGWLISKFRRGAFLLPKTSVKPGQVIETRGKQARSVYQVLQVGENALQVERLLLQAYEKKNVFVMGDPPVIVWEEVF